MLLVVTGTSRLQKLLARLRPHFDVLLARDADEALSRALRGRHFDMIVCGLSSRDSRRLQRELERLAPDYLPRLVVVRGRDVTTPGADAPNVVSLISGILRG